MPLSLALVNIHLEMHLQDIGFRPRYNLLLYLHNMFVGLHPNIAEKNVTFPHTGHAYIR